MAGRGVKLGLVLLRSYSTWGSGVNVIAVIGHLKSTINVSFPVSASVEAWSMKVCGPTSDKSDELI